MFFKVSWSGKRAQVCAKSHFGDPNLRFFTGFSAAGFASIAGESWWLSEFRREGEMADLSTDRKALGSRLFDGRFPRLVEPDHPAILGRIWAADRRSPGSVIVMVT